MKRYCCPSCGHKWKPARARGRPKTAYYTASGETQHIDEWAFRLDVSVVTLRRWIHHFGGDFERALNLLDKDR
jgi:transposase-like protein